MGGDISTYTVEEMHFAALFHDLGKMGQQEGEYYTPNDSQWHIDKLGQIYKFKIFIISSSRFNYFFWIIIFSYTHIL